MRTHVHKSTLHIQWILMNMHTNAYLYTHVPSSAPASRSLPLESRWQVCVKTSWDVCRIVKVAMWASIGTLYFVYGAIENLHQVSCLQDSGFSDLSASMYSGSPAVDSTEFSPHRKKKLLSSMCMSVVLKTEGPGIKITRRVRRCHADRSR